MQKLVISFSGILRHLVIGDVSLADLETALFVFGSKQVYVDELKRGKYTDFENLATSSHLTIPQIGRIFGQLLALLDRAYATERVFWREPNEYSTYARLADMLTKHGYPIMAEEFMVLPPADPDVPHRRDVYGVKLYPQIKAFLERRFPDLQVIY